MDEGQLFDYFSVYFSWYNRMYTNGAKFPSGTHPFTIKSINGIPINYSQVTPVQSKEMRVHWQIYILLINGFEDLFTWIYNTVFFILLPLLLFLY